MTKTLFSRAMLCLIAVTAVFAASTSFAQGRGRADEIRKLKAETGAKVSIHPATGAARFVTLPTRNAGLAKGAARNATAEEKSAAFFHQYGNAFGVKHFETDLQLQKRQQEDSGATHLTFQQYHMGVPVFGAQLKSHVDKDGLLEAVNGTYIPDLTLGTTPSLSTEQAISKALKLAKGGDKSMRAVSAKLYVYQLGLTKGVDEGRYLVYEVQVSNGTDRREFLYVNAHTGELVDRVTGIYDSMYRRAYDGRFLSAPPPEYPGTPYWVEGQSFPTASSEANNMIESSKDTYDFFYNAFGRDSFDGTGKMMDSIFNRGYQCPNASWNGTFISFCNGLTVDDVTAHEWGHAYTEYTHGLIYQWQSGALNESYSDIYGETIDRINGRGTDTPDNPRTDACSAYQEFPPALQVTAPSNIAGTYTPVGTTVGWGGAYTNAGVTADIAFVDDGSLVAPLGGAGDIHDACTAIPAGALNGKIAFANRGGCGFKLKAYNAQQAGAIGVIVGNIASTQTVGGMSNDPSVPAVTTPTILLGYSTSTSLRTEFAVPNTVTGTIKKNLPSVTDDSVRWLVGEDSTAAGLFGALRDMSNPNCFANPAKVSDQYYTCGTGDQGGVHTNSGVPNKAYQLAVDGGTFNGQTIVGMGLTKAAHIYFRAADLYQGPATNFAEHADALEQSCSDLIGVDLASLTTGAPSGEVIDAGNCAELSKAILATELRNPPTQCGFQPLLKKNPPSRCGAGTIQVDWLKEDFESLASGWSTYNTKQDAATFTERNWVRTNQLPNDRTGYAYFGIDQPGGDCNSWGEAGVLHLQSPAISLPEGATNVHMTFDHWVATEAGWDGGNVKASTNSGAWTLVGFPSFTYNPYNLGLATAGQGNTNPLAGQAAFSGSDGGSVAGSWGRSQANLSGYAGGNSSLSLRWDMGNDSCTGTFGWYVDDVDVYTCLPDSLPSASVDDISVIEGNAGKTPTATFTITLDHASTQPVTIGYKTGKGSAKVGTDYIPIEGTVTFAPYTLTQQVTVVIRGDNQRESDEDFFMMLRQPINAVIGDSEGRCVITNDD